MMELPHRVHRTIAAIVLLAMTGCGFSRHVETYSGTLLIDAPQVGSIVGGTIVDLRVSDGDRVERGEVLVRLDDARERAQAANARAERQRAQEQLSLLRAGTREADLRRAAAQEEEAHQRLVQAQADAPARVTASQADLQRAQAESARARAAADQARRDERRAAALWRTGDVSRSSAEAARLQLRQAEELVAADEATVASARDRARSIRASVDADLAAVRSAYAQARQANLASIEGARPQEIAQAQAALAAASAQVHSAEAALAQLTVRAPVDGVVEDLGVRRGDVTAPSVPLMTIVPAIDPYLRIYVPQRRLGRFRIGEHVRVRSDAFPDRAFDGRVEQIDRRAQFTPRDVQAPEDRAEVDFGVKIDVRDPRHELRAGTTAQVEEP